MIKKLHSEDKYEFFRKTIVTNMFDATIHDELFTDCGKSVRDGI